MGNKMRSAGCAYKLSERVENDDHDRKHGESGEDFDVADICETLEGEVLEREDRSQVSCHQEEDEDKLTRPKVEGV